jgi:23S rRNA G2445 N2-methylase RlmL
MRTPLFDGEAWERVRQEVASGAAEEAAPIYGSDRHPGAIQATEANAERAGVRGSLTLARAPLGRAPLPSSKAGSPGALVTNPPYGKRTGDRSGLRSLYQMLGQVVRRLGDGWRVGLVAADRRLALRTGLPLRNALLTEHGGTKVRLMVGQLG